MKSLDHLKPNQGILLWSAVAAILFCPVLSGQDSGPVRLSLADLSADLQIATGGSSVDDSALLNLQGGHHDPRKRGFTFQGLELGMQGVIDPYLSLDAAILYTIDAATNESHFEMEEAFLTSSQLPFGLHEKGVQLEAGQMLTEFGIHNPTHIHERNWLDKPVINTRIFGGGGMQGMGMRVGVDKPTSWLSQLHLGIQDAGGERMTSFNYSAGGETIGGISAVENEVKGLEDFAYLIRAEKDIAGPAGETSWVIGASGLCGPNATGDDGRTIVLGADISMKWTPSENDEGWPYLIWQTEIMRRRFMLGEGSPGDGQGGALQIGEGGISENDNLMDWGGYSQVLWGYRKNWAVGLRYEYASGSSSLVDSSSDPARDDRQRISPVLIWTPTGFSRFRLQYNYDLAEHLDESPVHSIWVGMEVHFGEHTAGAH